MGQIYSTYYKVVDKELFIKLTNLFVKRRNKDMNKYFSKCNLKTVDNCIKAMLAVDTQSNGFRSVEHNKGFKQYFNQLDETCSWNNTLMEWFATVAISLADESDLEIVSSDNTHRIIKLKVICGVAQVVEIM